MVVFVVKRYAVREAKKVRYAVRKGEVGVTLMLFSDLYSVYLLMHFAYECLHSRSSVLHPPFVPFYLV